MGIKNILSAVGAKAANKVSKLAALSADQVHEVIERREMYLDEMPDPLGSAAEEMTRRLLSACGVEIYNAYLSQLDSLYVPVERSAEYEGNKFDANRNIRFFNITKWVADKSENSLEKLVNVYQVLSQEQCNISLVFHRTCDTTNVYLAVTNTGNDDNNVNVNSYSDRLLDAVRGNFPGSECSGVKEGKLPCLDNKISYSVASATNIPAEKSEKFISQTIEKLLDGIVPELPRKEYILILMATPALDVEERKFHLAQIYSAMAPYASWTTNFTLNENSAFGSSATVGLNIGASAGVQNGQNASLTDAEGKTASQSDTNTKSDSEAKTETKSTTKSSLDGESITKTKGEAKADSKGTSSMDTKTHTTGKNKSHADSVGAQASATVNASVSNEVGASVGTEFLGVKADVNTSQSVTFGGSATAGINSNSTDTSGTNVSDAVSKAMSKTTNQTLTQNVSEAVSHNVSNSVADTVGKAVARTAGSAISKTLGQAVTKTVSRTSGISKATSFGINFGANFARGSNVTATIGKNEGITQSFTNFTVKHALELLESQMKRLEQSTALGMWDFAAYVLSEDQNVANNVAHAYLALTQGEESYMSHAAVNLWRGDMSDNRQAREICGYLRDLRHPLFVLNPEAVEENETFNEYPPLVTATTNLSGKELAYSLNFPRKSIPGLPVLECAQFGRNVVTYTGTENGQDALRLGRIFHMNRTEKAAVELSRRSLASHTFITGSTGSGKSNTVYGILENALDSGVGFTVVEPAKGEYKHVFGTRPEVSVYGTNPALTPLLRLDPFSFPEGIHVLEHMDRLVELFNVCWPMYAAMPAVLKGAVERAYSDCGWDLLHSVNRYGEAIYPSFADVARNVREIIDTSEYDTENKGAYKGSLLTRLQSLTSGLNGVIFSSDGLSDRELFDGNVIIDLSRVGSSETKSLLMGMLVLKLQEYRMTSGALNAGLRHLTVLEEAHNLLRRTSPEQSAESANLMGKSVEMLSNAIAEMRTYGEGFIIADQAPGLLDLAAIRNTNTKILLRLPDQEDRELAGRAAGLNDDQIDELAKLPCGVAAVYQNEWVQPVLCKVDKHTSGNGRYTFVPTKGQDAEIAPSTVSESLLDCIMNTELMRIPGKVGITKLKDKVLRSGLDTAVKRDLLEYLASGDEDDLPALRRLIYDFLSAGEAVRAAQRCREIDEWTETVMTALRPSVLGFTKRQIDLAMQLILYEQAVRDHTYDGLFSRYIELKREERTVS